MHSDLSTFISVLSKAGVIIYPSDTLWGLGCDAINKEAVSKIFSLKKRKKKSPLIVLLYDENKLFDYVQDVPDIAFDLIEMSDHPITIVFENGKRVADQVLGEDGSIAIRICKDSSCGDLLKKYRKPLVSTSVNISGEQFAHSISDMDPLILSEVDAIYNDDYIVERNKPSQIIRLNSNGSFNIIRR